MADEKREDKRGGDQPKIKSQLVERVGAATVRVAVEHRRELHRPWHEHLHGTWVVDMIKVVKSHSEEQKKDRWEEAGHTTVQASVLAQPLLQVVLETR